MAFASTSYFPPAGGSSVTTKGDLQTYSTEATALAVGVNTTVLTADSTAATGLKWGAGPLGTKGDIFTYSTLGAALAVGTDGQMLRADSAAATGLIWSRTVFISDSATNTVLDAWVIRRQSSGAGGAAGIGVGLDLQTYNASNAAKTAGKFRATLTTATAASEVGAVGLAIMGTPAGTVPAAGSEQYIFKPAQLLCPKGTAAAPSLCPGNTNNCGIFSGIADSYSVAVGLNGNETCNFTDTGIKLPTAYSSFIATYSAGITLGVTGAAEKWSFHNATPVVQYATTGTTTGFTANASANAVFNESTFTGNTGSTAYTLSDVVRCLKLKGLMTA